MTSQQFSLSWNSYQNNICSGLSSLQQNSQFVDMTLAADGHHVKVHQLMMSLASPYIKDLIISSECSHPIIFLNNISQKTLTSMLKYIYTGEVVVDKEEIRDVLIAAKALHLKGFDETGAISTMLATTSNNQTQYVDIADVGNDPFTENITEIQLEYISNPVVEEMATTENTYEFVTQVEQYEPETMEQCSEIDLDYILCTPADEDTAITENTFEFVTQSQQDEPETTEPHTSDSEKAQNTTSRNTPPLQYTLSDQGTLQLILNRFIYYPSSESKTNGNRPWQCVEYLNYKCPATVFTKDEVVIERQGTHTHSFHDRKILNKVRAGLVFTNIQNAEETRKVIQNMRIKKDNTLNETDNEEM